MSQLLWSHVASVCPMELAPSCRGARIRFPVIAEPKPLARPPLPSTQVRAAAALAHSRVWKWTRARFGQHMYLLHKGKAVKTRQPADKTKTILRRKNIVAKSCNGLMKTATRDTCRCLKSPRHWVRFDESGRDVCWRIFLCDLGGLLLEY